MNYKNKNLRKTGILRTFMYITIILGAALILYPTYTNFVVARQEEEVLSAWEDQQEAFFEEKEAAEAEETIEVIEDPIEVSKENGAIEEDGEAVDLVDDPSMTAGSTVSELSIYEDLTAEDFFPLKITIPKIELEWISYESTKSAVLKKGPGHESMTPLPGDIGRSTISGHRTTYGAPFNRVDELEEGDLIYLETIQDELFVYQVTGQQIVKPTDVWILHGTDKKELLLTTCDPKYSAANRLIIIAELVDIFSFGI